MKTTYRTRVKQWFKHYRTQGRDAHQAILAARYTAKYGYHENGISLRGYKKLDILPVYADEQTTELEQGYSVKVEVVRDDYQGKPWEMSDGHGVIAEERTRREGEHWENWLLYSDRGYYVYYDYEQTLPKAIADGWNAPPYHDGDAQARAYRAMRRDYDYLRGWFNEDWHYVGLIVTLYFDNGATDGDNESEPEEIAKESLCPIDSSAIDHIAETARGFLASMLRTHRDEERAARIASETEASEAAYWAARDVITTGARA